MKIKFKKDTELTIVEEYDEASDCIVRESNEIFRSNEILDVDLIEGNSPNYVDIQFGDGSVAHGVLKSCFVEIG